MEKQIKYIVILFALFLFSCEKEEQPIKPYDRGDVLVRTINTGNNGDYSKQLFYDIETNTVVKTVNRTSWDLGFSSNTFLPHIILNSSNKMEAAELNTTNFDSITSVNTTSLNFTWDHSSGLKDSLALKNAISTQHVFIVNRGDNPDLSARGIKKIQVLNYNDSTYVLKHADVDNNNLHIDTIKMNQTVNFTSFTFDFGGNIVDVEPNKETWDLLFSQYTHTFYISNPPTSYSVNGTLLNPYLVSGAKVFNKPFSDVSLDDLATHPLSDTLDVIGYNWKYYNLDESQYTVYPNQNYLIQNQEGFYYKLRFVDFYDDMGIKGTPKFEMIKL